MRLGKNNKYGIIGTIVVHGIVLVILLLFGFSAPVIEYPEPDGIVVDFGELVIGDDTGAPETVAPESSSEIVPEASEPPAVTQTEVPSIPIQTPTTQVTETVPEISPEEKERIRQEEEFKARMDALAGKMNQSGNGDSGTAGNSENGKETGMPGNPDGSGNSGNKKGAPGNPLGNGDAVVLVKPNNTTNCDNPIVLTVKVNAAGKVVAIQKTETALSEQTCIDAAKSAAMKTTFSPDTKEIRYAKITYEYTISK